MQRRGHTLAVWRFDGATEDAWPIGVKYTAGSSVAWCAWKRVRTLACVKRPVGGEVLWHGEPNHQQQQGRCWEAADACN